VTLSKRTEEIVRTQLETGRYATPDEVVNHLIEVHLPLETLPECQPGPSAAELKASLLAAVSKPTREYRKGDFVEVAKRAVAEEHGA